MNALVLALVFATAFIVVLYATPSLIKVAILKRLFDEPATEKYINGSFLPLEESSYLLLHFFLIACGLNLILLKSETCSNYLRYINTSESLS